MCSVLLDSSRLLRGSSGSEEITGTRQQRITPTMNDPTVNERCRDMSGVLRSGWLPRFDY